MSSHLFVRTVEWGGWHCAPVGGGCAPIRVFLVPFGSPWRDPEKEGGGEGEGKRGREGERERGREGEQLR